MSGIDVVLLGLALAVDAFVVSFSYGLILKRNRWRNAVSLGAATGLGQFVMPVAGWYGTNLVHGYIESIDHWIAFILLGIIGGKMLIDGIKAEDDEETGEFKLDLKELFLLAIATSIDALSVGFTTAGYGLVMAVVCSLIVAVVTFVICETGLCLGKTLGTKLSGKADVLGGVILIGIGIVSWGRGM